MSTSDRKSSSSHRGHRSRRKHRSHRKGEVNRSFKHSHGRDPRWQRIFIGILLVLVVVAGIIFGGRAVKKIVGNDGSYYQNALAFHEQGDHKAAVIELKNALSQKPRDADARWLLGESYLALGQSENARKELKLAQKLGFSDPKLLVALVRSYLLTGEYEQAFKFAREWSVLSVDPIWQVLRGQALLGLGDMSAAGAAFADALEQDPGNAAAKRGLIVTGLQSDSTAAAKRAVAQALESATDDLATWLLKGELELTQEKYPDAEDSYTRALKIAPDSKFATEGLVRALLGQRRASEAVPHLQVLVAKYPDDSMVAYLRALVARRKGDPEVARDALRQVLETNPGHPPSLLLYGEILYLLSEHEQAAEHLEHYVRIKPNNLQGRALYATVLLELGQAQQAIAVLRPIASSARNNPKIAALLAAAYTKSDNREQAVIYREQAEMLGANVSSVTAQSALDNLTEGETDAAVADLETAIQASPEIPEARLMLVLSHLKKGRIRQAHQVVSELLKTKPEYAPAHNLMGTVLEFAGNPKGARKGYQRALELDPNFTNAALNLAKLDIREGQHEQGIAGIRQVLKRERNHPQALVWMAKFASDEGDTTQSLRLLERARSGNPTAAQPRMILANHYFRRGDIQSALKISEELKRIAPKNARAMYLLARSQMAAGQLDEAIVVLKALIRQHPDSAQVPLQLAIAYERKGDRLAQRDALKRTLEANPTQQRALVKLGLLELRESNIREAIRIARELKVSHPGSEAGFILHGDILVEQGLDEDAAKLYELAYTRTQNTLTIVRLFRARYGAGQRSRASSLMQKWLEKHPGDIIARGAFADTLALQGETSIAVREYEKILEQRPDNLELMLRLAWLYHEKGDARDLRLAESAFQAKPQNPLVMDTYGWFLLQAGLSRRGHLMLKKALAGAPKNPRLRYHHAVSLAKTGDIEGARDALMTLLDSKRDFRQRGEARALLRELEQR